MTEEQAIDFDKEMVGTIEVPEADRMDLDALSEWFTANVEGFEGPLSYTKFKGGQSNPTYLLHAATGERLVLRREPPGALLPSAHDVSREWRCLAALECTRVPVPRPLAFCSDAVVTEDSQEVNAAPTHSSVG